MNNGLEAELTGGRVDNQLCLYKKVGQNLCSVAWTM